MTPSVWLFGLKVAILIATGFEQSEMVGPKQALEEAGAIVHIVSPTEGTVKGWDCIGLMPKDEFPVDITLGNAKASDYDALIIPGGFCPDDLRIDENALAFVKDFSTKPIAAICHGPCVLINAELVRDKTLTSWPSIKMDLTNAGANWVDKEVVRDGYLITSRGPDDIPAFNRALLELFSEFLHQKMLKHEEKH